MDVELELSPYRMNTVQWCQIRCWQEYLFNIICSMHCDYNHAYTLADAYNLYKIITCPFTWTSVHVLAINCHPHGDLIQRHTEPTCPFHIDSVKNEMLKVNSGSHKDKNSVNNMHIFVFVGATIYFQHFIFNTVYVIWMCWFCMQFINETCTEFMCVGNLWFYINCVHLLVYMDGNIFVCRRE